MALTKYEQYDSIKGKGLSILGYCSKVAAEIDLVSFILSKEKLHNRDKTSSTVETIAHWVYITINKDDNITISSMSLPSSKNSDSENVNLEVHSEGSLSSKTKRRKGIKMQVKDKVCTRGKIWKKGNVIV